MVHTHVIQVQLLPRYLPYAYILSNREMVQYNPPPPKKLSSVLIIIIIIKKQRTPESGGISKLNLEQSFSYIKLFLYCSNVPWSKKCEIGTLPVTKSLPLLHVYIRSCQVVLVLYVPIYSTVPPTNLVVTYLPTVPTVHYMARRSLGSLYCTFF